MIDFKRKRRAYIMPVFQLIRKILNIFKKYAYPDYIATKSVYQLYVEDQNYKCFLHFKELLKTSLLLSTEPYELNSSVGKNGILPLLVNMFSVTSK